MASRRLRALALVAGPALALVVAADALAAGPPFPPRDPDQPVVDETGVLDGDALDAINESVLRLNDELAIDAVVYVQLKPESNTVSEAYADARTLADAWSVGSGAGSDGIVVLVDLDESRCHGQFQLYADQDLRLRISDATRQSIFDEEVLPLLKDCRLGDAIQAGLDGVESKLTGIVDEPSGDIVEPSFAPDATDDAGVLLPGEEEPPADDVPLPRPGEGFGIEGQNPGADFGPFVALIAIAGIAVTILSLVVRIGGGFRGGTTVVQQLPLIATPERNEQPFLEKSIGSGSSGPARVGRDSGGAPGGGPGGAGGGFGSTTRGSSSGGAGGSSPGSGGAGGGF